jgi:hypothetical protein
MNHEAKHVALARGKWSQPLVPHRGWTCVDHYDAFEAHGDEEFETCEMCETTPIRFVHLMEHPDYAGQLHCGCVCAGHMEQSKVRAETRDKGMRNRAVKRTKFPTRKGWRVSVRGTPHIKVDGYHLMVVHRKGGFAVGVTPPGSTEPIWGQRIYKAAVDAQLGCFDALEYIRNKRN